MAKNAKNTLRAKIKKEERIIGKEVKVVKKNVGHYTFIAGVILAIIAGLLGIRTLPYTTLILVLLGLVVGFLNITAKDTTEFLVAAIALIVAGTASGILTIIPMIGLYLQNILSAIAVFVAPAAIIVALKAVVQLAEK